MSDVSTLSESRIQAFEPHWLRFVALLRQQEAGGAGFTLLDRMATDLEVAPPRPPTEPDVTDILSELALGLRDEFCNVIVRDSPATRGAFLTAIETIRSVEWHEYTSFLTTWGIPYAWLFNYGEASLDAGMTTKRHLIEEQILRSVSDKARAVEVVTIIGSSEAFVCKARAHDYAVPVPNVPSFCQSVVGLLDQVGIGGRAYFLDRARIFREAEERAHALQEEDEWNELYEP